MRRAALLGAAGAAALCSLLALSCASAPRAVPPEAAPGPAAFARVGPGGVLYAAVDVSAARPLIEEFAAAAKLDKKKLADVYRARSAELGLFPGAAPRWRIASPGSYPTTRAAISFALSPSWRRVKADKPYWKAKSGLSLAFDADGAALLSDDDPWAAGGAPALPASYAALPSDAAVRGWVPEPSERISASLGPAAAVLRFPVQELCFALIGEGGSFRLRAVAAAPGEREGRALEAVLRLLRNFGAPEGSLLSLLADARMSRSGAAVELESRALSAREAVDLLRELLPPTLYLTDR